MSKICLPVLLLFSFLGFSQNKKEQIELLNKTIDSLNVVILGLEKIGQEQSDTVAILQKEIDSLSLYIVKNQKEFDSLSIVTNESSLRVDSLNIVINELSSMIALLNNKINVDINSQRFTFFRNEKVPDNQWDEPAYSVQLLNGSCIVHEFNVFTYETIKTSPNGEIITVYGDGNDSYHEYSARFTDHGEVEVKGNYFSYGGTDTPFLVKERSWVRVLRQNNRCSYIEKSCIGFCDE